MTIILWAIPFFFLLISIELIAEKVKGTAYYRVNDAINSLTVGVLSRVTGILKALVPLTIYAVAYEYIALFTLPDSMWTWVAAFIIYDFFYYWNHRYGHEVSLFWAAHVVHHSSEEYNLTTALRQTSGSFFSWIFYLPMALVGFTPETLLAVAALNLVYQFWVHTRHVPKLGWFEYVFVSPSNHRVHHAQNDIYLDRNYGGVFIVWDRLFGTFQEELDHEPPIYGVRKALKSWDPVWANLQVYSQLMKDSWRTKRWSDKCKVWFGRTGWRPADVSEAYPLARVNLATFKKFDVQLSMTTKVYCLLQHSVTVLIALMFMLNLDTLTNSSLWGLSAFIIFSAVSVGLVMEKRPVSFYFELIKNIGLIVGLLVLSLPSWLTIALFFGTSVSMCLLHRVYRDIHGTDLVEGPIASQ
ncbi:sterol desaturase family protein [Aestuariibacter sp. AA17]|uniref:Sterol desaturase family protein n=1 Tax=Fluctibacter corallii TaxID=2984329 RepID=A0ABT3AB35_9ALTE|nr:sterol desaturase family protein [Aestuariibacter sp. AA17]MCV2885881.1 sterol desaturase family protein [Aestuariibacter sp. AA17]